MSEEKKSSAEKSVLEGDLEKEEIVAEKDQFQDDNEHEGTSEDVERKIEAGEKDADVYSEEGREALEEDDEIEPWEEGFAKGAEPDKHGQ